jgi:hypothetical protein
MNMDWKRDKEGQTTGASTKVVFKSKCEDGNSKIQLDQGNMKIEKEFTPKDWKTNDWTLALKFVGDSVPKDSLFKMNTEVKYGFPKISKDFGLGGSVAVTCGSDKKLIGNTTLVACIMKNYSLGFLAERNLKESTNSALDFVFATKQGDAFFFAAWSHLKTLLTVGGTSKVDNKWVEKLGAYATVDGSSGSWDKRSFAVVASSKISNSTSLRMRADIEDSLVISTCATTKVTDNMKIRFSDQIDPISSYKNRELKSYVYGMSLDFDL